MKSQHIKLALVAALVTALGSGYAYACYRNHDVDCLSQCDCTAGLQSVTYLFGARAEATSNGSPGQQGHNQSTWDPNGECHCTIEGVNQFGSVVQTTCDSFPGSGVEDTNSTACQF